MVPRIATISLLLIPLLATEGPRGAALPGTAAPSYIVTDLGTFGNIQSAEAFDVNEAGQVVGRASNRAFLWQNTSKTDLGSPTRAVLWSGGRSRI